MTLSGLDVIVRCDDFEARAAAYELRGWQWTFLHEIDGAAELRDVAMAGGVDLDLAIDFVAESEAAGLVRVVAMTLHEFRLQHGIAEPEAPHEAAATDTLAGYESAPPAWMMEEPVATHDEEPVAAHEWEAPETHEVQPAVASYDWTPDAYATDHHEAASEHHEEHSESAVPSYEWTPDAHVAEHHDDTMADASSTVAGLMSLEAHGDAAAVHAEHSEPEMASATNGHASNGHSSYSWEPMSLVTTVDPVPAEEPHEEHVAAAPAAEMPDGISIWLSQSPEAHAEHAEHTEHAEPTQPVEPVHAYEPQEQGSISFSFSPDTEPMDRPAVEPAAASEPVAQEAPVFAAATTDVQASAANHTQGAAAPQQLRMDASSAAAGKGDLVGNLIARAFTFRLK